MYKKTVFILLLFTILITSCRGKKEVSCPSFDPVVKENKKEKKGTDRDSFKYKRVELTGSLLYDLFKEKGCNWFR